MENNNLREARLIIPAPPRPSCGAFIPETRALILDAFHGYTETRGVGAYRPPHQDVVIETIYVFDIAAPDTKDASAKLRAIAKFVRHAADQEAVYLRHPSGTVEFVTE